MNIAFKAARLAAALALGAGIAAAGPIFTILYDPTVSFSAADKTQIQDAVNFYASNMTGNFAATIAIGARPVEAPPRVRLRTMCSTVTITTLWLPFRQATPPIQRLSPAWAASASIIP
jgi:hypothetical protein